MQLHLLTSNMAARSATTWAVNPKLKSTVTDVIACNFVIRSCSISRLRWVELGDETVAGIAKLTPFTGSGSKVPRIDR